MNDQEKRDPRDMMLEGLIKIDQKHKRDAERKSRREWRIQLITAVIFVLVMTLIVVLV